MDLGYSGTNSGGSLYIISSVFRNNKGGLAPNTLDSELLPPERETFIIGNLIENNNNNDAPATKSTYLSFGNGVIIAGGNNNIIKNNVIANHDLYGVILTAAADVNYWPAHGNRVEDNLILSSNRADMAISGVSNLGNCFKGNYFNTSIPPGLQSLNNCDAGYIPLVQISQVCGHRLQELFMRVTVDINKVTGDLFLNLKINQICQLWKSC